MLLLATAGWGLSFPLGKAALALQTDAAPDWPSWAHAALSLGARLGIGAAVLALMIGKALRGMRKAEVLQGTGLGLAGGIGLLLQADGLQYTDASTSAFLTQCCALFVVLIEAFRCRASPPARTAFSCAVMVAGMAVLSGFDPRAMHLGRGEAETLGCAFLFAFQILLLEAGGRFSGNHPLRVAFLMFLTKAILMLTVFFAAAPAASQVASVACAPGVAALTAALAFACTLMPYALMVRFQPCISPSHAGIVYCAEPVWASWFALWVPGLLAASLPLAYANEPFTVALATGGILVTAANLIMASKPASDQNI